MMFLIPGNIPDTPKQDRRCETCADKTGMGQNCFGCRIDGLGGGKLFMGWMPDRERFDENGFPNG